ncbi:MOSC domain-containing protein [Hyphococcus flavus]|uniref:MOSC domain-containing protein n=1 Tax=Hyphococcus flavus TaxID=1866326 RepID=A0AAE9Z9Y9_9PROT|nr:MOSC N-terminal beta barrel domain-containing protein [Hyphococcus flavus]WDI30189.1 MOSC domain-containing protein [Hyphococcus flavus]
MKVSSLHYYPVKGVRGVACERAAFDERGLVNDRRWLVTSAEGQSLTQRDHPVLAQVEAKVTSDGLRLSCNGAECDVALPPRASRRRIKVWRDEVDAMDAGDKASSWFSTLLDRPARLYFMDEEAERMTTAKWSPVSTVSFADMHPFLIATTESLQALNDSIIANGGEAVGMERFRPNIVIDGAEAWADDSWLVIKIGDYVFDVIIPCDRCVVTTKDQMTGESAGKEPLRTLAKIRKSADAKITGALFGWRCSPRGSGELKVGDKIEVLERRAEPWPIV